MLVCVNWTSRLSQRLTRSLAEIREAMSISLARSVGGQIQIWTISVCSLIWISDVNSSKIYSNLGPKENKA